MNRLWSLAVLTGSMFALFMISIAGTANPAYAQGKGPQDVRVVNTTAQPVPVAVEGTPNVAVTSLPAVQVDGTPNVAVTSLPAVQLDGTPDVAVTSLPAVQIDGAPDVAVTSMPAVQIDGTPSVTVVNTLPIPVSLGVEREPIDRIHTLTFPPGQIGGGDNIYTVPFGRMLVVEQFFVRSTIGTGAFSQATLDRLNGDPAQYPILMEHQGTDHNGLERYVGSIQGPLFFPAGTTLQGNYLRTGTGSTVMVWSFTGYLDRMP